jgi:predicted Zn finger-like uncharacterized protein
VVFKSFACPDCQALYQLVRDEAGPLESDRKVACHKCGVPFPNRKGKFNLHYFLLREASLAQRAKRPRPATGARHQRTTSSGPG